MSTQQIILSHSIPLPNISCIEKIHAGIMVTVLLVLICAIGDCRIANLAGQVFTKDKGCIVHRQIISAGHIWQQLSDVRSVREFFFHSICYSRDNDICGLLRWYQKTWGKCIPIWTHPRPSAERGIVLLNLPLFIQHQGYVNLRAATVRDTILLSHHSDALYLYGKRLVQHWIVNFFG